MSATLSQVNRRRLDAAQPRVDKIVEADAAFFARFPRRSHRVRLASSAEIEQNAAITGAGSTGPGPGRRWFVAVRQIAPGVRMRLFTLSFEDAETDMAEGEARKVFGFLAASQPKATHIEAKLKAALEKRGAA